MRLDVEGAHKRFRGRPVLDGLDLACEGPGITIVAGENGSGKSTLLRIVAGVLRPDRGRVLLDGAPLDAPARRHLGYAPEGDDPFPFLTVAEWISLVAALKRVARPDGAQIDRLGVTPLLGQRMGALSLGQRRRALLLAALLGSPWLLVLDEPTNGLDRDGIRTLIALLGEHATRGAALVASHDAAFVEAIATRRVHLRHGRLTGDGS